MKLIIAGSREITDIRVVQEAIESSGINLGNVTEVVSGTARGVDKLGEAVAVQNKIKIKRFPADWDKYGKSAGYRRNAEMAKYADVLLAVWDGESKGTKHMINLMRKEGKRVILK